MEGNFMANYLIRATVKVFITIRTVKPLPVSFLREMLTVHHL